MKRLIFSFVALVSLVEPTALRAQQSPIIDRNLFFGEIEIAGAQISPDGQYLSFLKPYKGTRNIWVKKASDPFTAARPVSAGRRHSGIINPPDAVNDHDERCMP